MHHSLDSLQVEIALFIIVSATRCLDGQVDVLKQWEQNLTKDLTPKLKTEQVNALLQDSKEDLKRLMLVLIAFVKWQIGQVRQNWEPKTFLDA